MVRCTHATFSIEKFVAALCEKARVVIAPSGPPLVLATGCSGMGGPTLVLRSIIGSAHRVREIFASECRPATAHTLAANVSPEHIFADVAAAAVSGEARASCLLHQRNCPVPQDEEDLFIAGFVCKGNSAQNPTRFREDAAASHHMATFWAVRQHLERRKPKVAVLENVAGLQLPRGGSQTDTMLSYILDQLRWPFYTVAVVRAAGHPLPTARPRLYFLLARSDVGDAALLATRAEDLIRHASAMPRHHCETFFGDTAATSWWQENGAVVRPKGWARADLVIEAEYAQAIARITAQGAARLPDPIQLPPLSERESSKHLTGRTPWLRAQCDVYHEIAKHEASSLGPELGSTDYQHALADIGQSANRGRVCVDGSVPTVCTSTALWSYKLHRMITPSELLALNGFPDYNLSTLSWFEATSLAGNGMCSAALACVLLPALAALGHATWPSGTA